MNRSCSWMLLSMFLSRSVISWGIIVSPQYLTIFGRTFTLFLIRGGSVVITHLVSNTNYRRISDCSQGGIKPRFPVVLTGGNRNHILSVTNFCWYKGKHTCYYRSINIEVLLHINIVGLFVNFWRHVWLFFIYSTIYKVKLKFYCCCPVS